MKKGWFTILIANYNGESYLPKCLESVFKSKYKQFKVLVADDNSTDNSINIIENLRKEHKNLSIIKSSKNRGPSGMRNIALRKIDTEYVYLLDNDTEVDPNWLSEIAKVFKNSIEVGAVQSLLIDFDKRNKIQNAGLKMIPQTGWAIGISDGKDIKERPKKPEEILGLSAALAVKTEVIKKGVNFDSVFVHYSEDLDFSWRIWVSGYSILLAPNSFVYHQVKPIDERKNVGANKEIVYFHLSKNALTSLTKNFDIKNLIKYLPQCLFVLTVRAILVLIVRRDLSSLKGTAKALMWYMRNIPDILGKRRFIQKKLRKTKDRDYFGKIMLPYGLLGIYKKFFSQTKLLPVK